MKPVRMQKDRKRRRGERKLRTMKFGALHTPKNVVSATAFAALLNCPALSTPSAVSASKGVMLNVL